MRIFSLGKAAQGFAARRTLCTPQPETRYDRPPSGKKTIYGWTLAGLGRYLFRKYATMSDFCYWNRTNRAGINDLLFCSLVWRYALT
jgi:hypothetical protein